MTIKSHKDCDKCNEEKERKDRYAAQQKKWNDKGYKFLGFDDQKDEWVPIINGKMGYPDA